MGMDSTIVQKTRYDDALMEYSVSVQQAKQLIDAGALLLDVRTAEERKLATIAKSVHIPIADLPERWKEIPKNGITIVYCHTGVRSLFASILLRRNGIDAHSMNGGIAAWSKEIDPEIPEY